MKKLLVDKKFENKKLSVFIQHQFDGLSINTIYKALRKKDIIVNGVRINNNISLHANDNITIYISDELLYRKIEIDIVYEDDNIIVINKPTGIEVISDNFNEKSVTDFLRELTGKLTGKLTGTGSLGSNSPCESEPKEPVPVSLNGSTPGFPAPCHRLDRNTSGLLLFAKNSEALNILLDKFKKQEIEKHYSCMVYGIPKKDEATLSAYLFKDTKKSLVYISDTPLRGYQKIITSYTVLSKNIDNNTSVLDVELHTGKTHQIRAHLAHIGLPIIGDRKIWN